MINTDNNAVYFLSLSLENVRCFGEKQTLDLSDGNGKPARWTVILGDNGTGKTTLLQVMAGMQFYEALKISGNREIGITLKWKSQNLYRRNDTILKTEACFAWGYTLEQNIECQSAITLNYTDYRYYNLSGGCKENEEKMLYNLNIFAYGANRQVSTSSLSKELSVNPLVSLLNQQTELINAEEWLLQTDYTASKESDIKIQMKQLLDQIIEVLINLLPSVTDIQIIPPTTNNPKPVVGFKTPDCTLNTWLRLDDLSLGYQTMIAWMVDLAAHMFQRYPDSPNPIAEPAVVLIDEIDLHLHPKWQRTIMSYLSERFVNTQFIVTAHSPLIVQAAENANIAVLKREGDQVVIHQEPQDVKGWRIDQLLTSDLFDLPSARSPHYETLLERRRLILSKAELTEDDQAELKQLEAEIGDLPTAETAEDIEAMDIIRQAAKILKPEI